MRGTYWYLKRYTNIFIIFGYTHLSVKNQWIFQLMWSLSNLKTIILFSLGYFVEHEVFWSLLKIFALGRSESFALVAPLLTDTPLRTETPRRNMKLDRDPQKNIGPDTGSDIIYPLCTEWQTGVKTLPCPKLLLWMINIKLICVVAV